MQLPQPCQSTTPRARKLTPHLSEVHAAIWVLPCSAMGRWEWLMNAAKGLSSYAPLTCPLELQADGLRDKPTHNGNK